MKGQKGLDRRRFLARLTALASLAAVYPAAALQQTRAVASGGTRGAWMQSEPWQTLAAVQEHLFPAGEQTPGAADIRALVYLHDAIENPRADGEDREFIINGAGWLDELAMQRRGARFLDLDEAARESLLRDIERSQAGQNWLSLLLSYLIEALLADPVYGGNPGGIGWQWLKHQPGYPLPPPDKRWFTLV